MARLCLTGIAELQVFHTAIDTVAEQLIRNQLKVRLPYALRWHTVLSAPEGLTPRRSPLLLARRSGSPRLPLASRQSSLRSTLPRGWALALSVSLVRRRIAVVFPTFLGKSYKDSEI